MNEDMPSFSASRIEAIADQIVHTGMDLRAGCVELCEEIAHVLRNAEITVVTPGIVNAAAKLHTHLAQVLAWDQIGGALRSGIERGKGQAEA